jgi:hemerythrin superfamily protein
MKMIRNAGKTEEEALYQFSKNIYDGTFDLAKWELQTSGELFKKSGDSFIIGYITLGDLEKQDRDEIFSKIKEYNKDRIKDYSSISELFKEVLPRKMVQQLLLLGREHIKNRLLNTLKNMKNQELNLIH